MKGMKKKRLQGLGYFFSGQSSGNENGYVFYMALSVILHAVVVIILVLSWHAESSRTFVPPKPISASLVTLPEQKPKAKPQVSRQQLAEKKRLETARKEKARKLAEQKRKAAARKKEQERQKALALKKEQQRKEQQRKEEQRREEQRKKEALANQQAQEEARRQQEVQRQKQAAIERALAEAAQAQQAAEQLEHDQIEQAKYVELIRQLASDSWSRPPSARNGMETEVRIKLSPFGDVLDISMTRSSGNSSFDQSVVQALRRASPFSEIRNLERRIFDQYFRQITFIFRPEDLVR